MTLLGVNVLDDRISLNVNYKYIYTSVIAEHNKIRYTSINNHEAPERSSSANSGQLDDLLGSWR